MKKYRRIVLSIYIHPDFYPPTINAIYNLSEQCLELIIITRNNCKEDFPIGENIKYFKIGSYETPYESELKSLTNKIINFSKFTFKLLQNTSFKKTDLLIIYDPIPLFSFFLINCFLPKRIKLWYHNHDIPESNSLRKYSIGWFSKKYEHKALKKMDYFTLPSNDRLQYYQMLNPKTKYSLIPNYPSKKIYKQAREIQIEDVTSIKIIYQGSIGKGHSIEEVITLLSKKINGKSLQLVLKGFVHDRYKNELNQIAVDNNVEKNIDWIGIGPYKDLQSITISCHIGIAIYKGTDLMNKTISTASNKIYEYAACGLPILVYDNEHFRKYLSNYKWVVFTDGSINSLEKAIGYIILNYYELSKQARLDFEHFFNFELYFKLFDPVLPDFHLL
jgi:glycosyltransferase involved in cell wall biosynthesis